MYTDPIADYLTRVRNAVKANHRVVEIPASNLKKEITKILFDQGYILSYKFDDTTVQGTIKIALKYNKETKESVIKKVQRISKLISEEMSGVSKSDQHSFTTPLTVDINIGDNWGALH